MNQIDYNQLLIFLPPAILISVLAFLARFFGKVITDQAPFTDDRKWNIELSGVMFMLNMITSGLIGVGLALASPWGIGHEYLHIISLLVLAFLGGSLYFNNAREGERVFILKIKALDELEKKSEGFLSHYINVTRKYIRNETLPIPLLYFVTLEYLTGNLYWIVAISSFTFLVFVWSATNYSFGKLKHIIPVDLYFIDEKREPLKGIRILKINEDNVRARVGDKIMIINKDTVLKIEHDVPANLL